MVGRVLRAVRVDAPVDRGPAASGAALVAQEPQPGDRGRALRPADCARLRLQGPAQARPHGVGVRGVHHAAGVALHHLRRHLRARRARGHAAGQHGVSADRRRAGEFRGHHRRGDAADPAAPAREPPPPEQDSHLHLLHFHRRQLRGVPHAAGRSAALPRLSQGRAVRVDAEDVADVGDDGRGPARDFQPARPV